MCYKAVTMVIHGDGSSLNLTNKLAYVRVIYLDDIDVAPKEEMVGNG